MRNILKKRDTHCGTPQSRLAQWLIVGLAVFSLLPGLSLAALWHVDGDVVSSGDGSSWATAFKTIQEAVDASATFDEIWVKQGTYVLSSQINLNKWVNLYGGFDGTETVRTQRDWKANVTTVDGDNAVRVFYITANAYLDGLTISHGQASHGAGIYVEDATRPTIINCTFTENNVTSHGGGIRTDPNSSTIITNCTFFNNHADGVGGAMYNEVSSVTISNSLFIVNNSYDRGGAIFNSSSSPIITNSTFTLNSANGGAMYNHYSSPTITNSIFWGDTRGEIWNNYSSPTVTYSIVQGGYTGEGNIDADPLFVNDVPGPTPLDLHLTAGSPAINSGTSEGAPDTDIEGKPRPMGAGYDMGAYESMPLS